MLFRKLLILIFELFFSSFDVLKLSYLLKTESELYLCSGGSLECIPELLHCKTGIIEIILDGNARVSVPVFPFTEHIVDAVLGHSFGDLTLNEIGELFGKRIVKLGFSLLVGVCLELRLYVLLVFGKRIELTYILGKLIVELREFLALDLMDPALEYGGLAGELFYAVIFGEGHIDLEILTDALAYDLILKSGDKSSASEFKAELFGFSAVKGLAVRKAFKIKDNGIGLLRGSVVNIDYSRVVVSYTLDLGIYLFVSYSLDLFLYF